MKNDIDQKQSRSAHLRRNRWVKVPNLNRRTDSELAASAVDAIEWLTTIPQECIRVRARNGWLNLEGAVEWEHQRNTVEEVTRHLPGVKGVVNAIAIQAEAARMMEKAS